MRFWQRIKNLWDLSAMAVEMPQDVTDMEVDRAIEELVKESKREHRQATIVQMEDPLAEFKHDDEISTTK